MMRTEDLVRERLAVLESAKAMLFYPPVILQEPPDSDISYEPGHVNIVRDMVTVVAPNASLESLNAEIACLNWVLSNS